MRKIDLGEDDVRVVSEALETYARTIEFNLGHSFGDEQKRRDAERARRIRRVISYLEA